MPLFFIPSGGLATLTPWLCCLSLFAGRTSIASGQRSRTGSEDIKNLLSASRRNLFQVFRSYYRKNLNYTHCKPHSPQSFRRRETNYVVAPRTVRRTSSRKSAMSVGGLQTSLVLGITCAWQL